MKTLLMRFGVAALLGVSAAAMGAAPTLAETVKITVLGVGDIYAFDQSSNGPSAEDKSPWMIQPFPPISARSFSALALSRPK